MSSVMWLAAHAGWSSRTSYAVRRVDRQDLVDRLAARGIAPATIQGPVLAAAHRLRQAPDLYAAARTARRLSPSALAKRANAAWPVAGLNRITLHECRHTSASFAISAGVNVKSLCDYMGHASITTTYDRYGHLMPGNERETAVLLDAYLTAASRGGLSR